ncbi:hypothetical protein Xentx_02765 [Xenorhabdus thuongxuanensis]|uniref:Uncharacterized protein n=1 Tax=Xenorhabdus thuongxuanensis TaxID=1873484 RepID=A0A1Q5TVM1_9GAMM|nr:hypothetical protein Xentx_02765 [Xenorhabdus thuongxuanensis]
MFIFPHLTITLYISSEDYLLPITLCYSMRVEYVFSKDRVILTLE